MIDPNHPDFATTPALRPLRFTYAPDGELAPLVSIVTPFFNTGQVFHETAATVLGQSFQRWEWMIVNDGSTQPEALALLAEYRERDPRILVLDLPRNGGSSAARNAGFAAARAEFVVQIDSDDLLEPTAIEQWFWFLLGHPRAAFVKGYSVGFGAQAYLWPRGFEQGRAFLDENQIEVTAMIRRSVHHAVGGYDTERRGGLEDWDFWLRCADAGHWGATVPEYHSWYRRRDDHGARWTSWNESGVDRFRAELRQRYPRLFKDGAFPDVRAGEAGEVPGSDIANPLLKPGPRLLLVVPWLRPGGADKCNLDLIGQLSARGWEVTVLASLDSSQEWHARFTELTPDVFVMPHFLHPEHGPAFVDYLIGSRRPDAVLISNSEFGYALLPHLRARFPALPLLDLNHMEEEHWRGGGYPRISVDSAAMLDRQIVISEHLRRWMIERGAQADKIAVCHLNVDETHWRPDPEVRAAVRAELSIAEDRPIIVYVGRICAQKQPLVFAETMHELARRGLEFVALVAGDGEDMPALRRKLKGGPAAAKVRLLGLQPNARVRALVQASDLLFLPSQWEGIALSLYEAMACGLAVVGADVGGQHELVTPECGVLLLRADAAAESAAYADAIAQLLADPQRLRSMELASRRRIEQSFRLEQMGDRIAQLLEAAVTAGTVCPVPSHDATEAARERAIELLAWQWRGAGQLLHPSRVERLLMAMPMPARYKSYAQAAYRIWRVGGFTALLARVRARLGR